jgi:linoleoyl-CoA desaturase
MSPISTSLPKYDKKYGNVYKQLQSTVDDYFHSHKKSKKGGLVMEITAIIAIFLFISVNLYRITNQSLSEILIFSTLSGLLIGFLATLGHEATHNTLSTRKWINNLVNAALDLIGFSTKSYRTKHAVHHNFTNVSQIDPDLNLGSLIRTEQSQTKYWFHRFQQYYFPILYAISSLHLLYNPANFTSFSSTLSWVKRMLPHFIVFIAIPIWFQGIFLWLVGYSIFMAIGGLYVSFLNQPMHFFDSSQVYIPTKQVIDKEFALLMIDSSTSYRPQDVITNYFTVGVNNHLMHSLFPNISSIHYPKLYGFVVQVLHKEEIHATSFDNFRSLIKSHYIYLKKLGN